MLNIRSGVVHRHGSGVWRLIDDEGNESKFQHASFPEILDEADVYFIDLNLDSYCENVQAKVDLDHYAATATSTGGFQAGAEQRLRSYIMEALLIATLRNEQERYKYLANLELKMEEVRSHAEASLSRKVTIALLKDMGLSG